MGTISQNDLKKVFSAVDARLKKKLDVYLIGGASAILGYNVSKETNDVDLDGGIDPDFNVLFQEEADRQGLDIYLSSKGVFSPPDDYRSRMNFEIFPKKNLRVWFLDQYDLAISKIDRGIEKDFEDIKRVHQKSPFDCPKLIDLFNQEYINVSAIGNPREKKMNLLDLISMLFGQAEMEKSKAKIEF
jgi:hypothetical protein